MLQFRSSFGLVELTDERRQHILAFHPEVSVAWEYIADTLTQPETIRRSKFDHTVIICYKQLPVDDKYLAVVVKKEPNRNFILTAYLTDRIQHQPL